MNRCRRGARTRAALWALALAFAGCDERSEADHCAPIEARLQACGLRAEPRAACGRLTSSCEARCVVNAPCGDLTATACGPEAPPPSLVACVAACRPPDAGVQHDPRADETGVEAFFRCKDGSGVLTLARVCDAVPNCRDGSDERVCGYASCGGPADAGRAPE